MLFYVWKKYFELNVTEDLADLLIGRYYIDGTKLIQIENQKDIINKKIKLRSPLYCKAENGICPICYGDLYKKLKFKQN